MLKQEQFDDSQSVPRPPSGSVPRVTPEELTSALDAIEARRQGDAKTIPLDQAVSELNLDSTPDEIWAEVQTQRVKAAAAQRTPPRSAVTAEMAAENAPMGLRRGSRRRPFAPLLIVGGILLLSNHGLLPHFGSRHVSVVSVPVTAPILRPLSAIPDDIEVYADASALAQISVGKPLAQVTVSENASGNRWAIVKRGGHVYLRGYIARADSLQSLQNQPLTIYSSNDSGDLEGESTSNITLRVDNTPLSKPSAGDDYLSVTISNFQPDPRTTLDPGS